MMPTPADRPESTAARLRIYDVAYHLVTDLSAERLAQSKDVSGVLSVSAGADAKEVAQEVKRSQASLVLVEERDKVVAVVAPDWVVLQVRNNTPHVPKNFEDAIDYLRTGEGGGGHEWLNFERIVVYYCETGEHYTGRCPCPDHNGPCTPEP